MTLAVAIDRLPGCQPITALPTATSSMHVKHRHRNWRLLFAERQWSS